jgi:Restriction endonuclease NotI
VNKVLKKPPSRFGIAEWYGHLFRGLQHSSRVNFADAAKGSRNCPFIKDVPELAPKSGMNCSKSGGVCSIRNFASKPSEGREIEFGPISATCPNRFLEGGRIIEEIAERVLGTREPLIVKEVPFLKRSAQLAVEIDGQSATSLSAKFDDVGRIDLVLVHPTARPLEWCAVELQAVYFSGTKMVKDFEEIRNFSGNGHPMPAGNRRPDFRSSGPKRLMPQLQIKVPTLSRWGKRMVVVVDNTFFKSIGPMKAERDISNADIVWLIVSFAENINSSGAELTIDQFTYTTLENAVTGLTAGVPATKEEFERRLEEKLSQQTMLS